ncbi:MAG: hypothetical protein U1A78_32225 [Polyangia bacterium]
MILADSFAELRPVFGRFTRWMREDVQHVFDTGGDGEWPERSEGAQERLDASKQARIEKIEAAQYNSLRGALRSEKRRAERRAAKTPASDSKLTARRQKSVERYELQLAELEFIAAGGNKDRKGFKKLYERVERREQRAQQKIAQVESGQLLGQIANSIAVDFDKSKWEMFSRIPWAGAHNEGARVGRGATLPPRTFLEWTPRRLQKFVDMANAYVLERAQKGGQGTTRSTP